MCSGALPCIRPTHFGVSLPANSFNRCVSRSLSSTTCALRCCALIPLSQVWKSVVPNTGRALREILATLIAQVVNFLASDNLEHVGIASRCLGDIVKKLGERVLPEIVPTLREVWHRLLFSTSTRTHNGALLGEALP